MGVGELFAAWLFDRVLNRAAGGVLGPEAEKASADCFKVAARTAASEAIERRGDTADKAAVDHLTEVFERMFDVAQLAGGAIAIDVSGRPLGEVLLDAVVERFRLLYELQTPEGESQAAALGIDADAVARDFFRALIGTMRGRPALQPLRSALFDEMHTTQLNRLLNRQVEQEQLLQTVRREIAGFGSLVDPGDRQLAVMTSDWFEAWSEATDPLTSPDMVLAGRDQAVEQLRALLADRPRIITIGGEVHPEELQAFLAAAIESAAASVVGTPALFVNDRGTFERLLAHPAGTVLIVPDTTWLPAQVGPHHVIASARTTSDCDVAVLPVAGQVIAEALKVAGVDRRDADELGELARRSLLAFRRRLAVYRALHRPSWAEPPVDRIHRRLLLVDRWHDRNEGDHGAVADLVGDGYASIEDQLLISSKVSGLGV